VVYKYWYNLVKELALNKEILVAISQKDTKRLWSRAAGRCSMCRRELTEDKSAISDSVLIGEQAHIVAEETTGPRGQSILSVDDRNTYHNLILLCPNDHTLIDKNPDDYPLERLYVIKSRHEVWVRDTLSKDNRRNEVDSITIDDLLEFHETIRPIILWLHRIVPREKSQEYFEAMQSFWTVSNVATDHISRELRISIDHLLRPLAAEEYIFDGGRHYADTNILIGAKGIIDHFNTKIDKPLEIYFEGEVERNLIYLNMHCELIQQTAPYLEDVDKDIISYIRLIVQHYQSHISNKGATEISDSFTDNFLSILLPFLVDRLLVSLPDKTDDRALDRIRQYAGDRSSLR
jgi:hypothetical protein